MSSVLRRNASDGKKNSNKDDKKKRKKREKDLVKGIKTRVEQFELDIEAQVNADMKAKNEKMPGCTRGLIAVLKFAFKAIIWCATIVFKVFMLLIKGCGKCRISRRSAPCHDERGLTNEICVGAGKGKS